MPLSYRTEENRMNLRRAVLASAVGFGIVAGSAMIAQGPPERNVNSGRHPNLAAAQCLVDQAFNKISAAQEANEWDMEGHAAKAKEHLEQASRELKAAAEAANHNRR
jgi:DNA-binding transcriptional regulator PaaX